MPQKTFPLEQIVGKLRQIEVLMSQGETVPPACKDSGITDQQRACRPAPSLFGFQNRLSVPAARRVFS